MGTAVIPKRPTRTSDPKIEIDDEELIGTDVGDVTLEPTPMDRNADRIGHRGADLAWLPAKRIRIDPVYQRGLNVRRVNDIAENFDIDVFGTIYVSMRQDSSSWALDGQHRMAAVQTIYGHDSDVKVPCHIVRNLSVEDEARIFYKMNRNRLSPTAFDGFKARLAFKDPVAVGIQEVVNSHGVTIRIGVTGHLKFHEVQAIAQCETLYRRGMLNDVLTFIGLGWKGEDSAHKAVLMRGVYVFLNQFHDEFYGDETHPKLRADRRARLVDTMADLPPMAIERRAKFYQTSIGDSAGTATARALHKAFNERLRNSMRLPKWGDTEDEEG